MYWHWRARDTDQGQAACLTFFLAPRFRAHSLTRTIIMNQTYSSSRQQAEIAFGKTQTEFFARGQATEALDTIAQARDAKTARLREARKAKELADLSSATGSDEGRRGR
jgi:hypothetical protein